MLMQVFLFYNVPCWSYYFITCQNNLNVLIFVSGCHFQFSSVVLCDFIKLLCVLTVKHAILEMKIIVSVESDIRVFAVISEA